MRSPEPATNQQWIAHEFAGVSLGDRRLEQTLVDAATTIADQPDASHPQRFDWNELRAFYRVVDAARAQPHLLQETHRHRTRQRMEACASRVLIIHDTTMLDFTTHATLQPDLGPIGNGGTTGFLQHNSLAFAPDTKQVLGLITQQTVIRQPQPEGETRGERMGRAHKESHLWLDGIREVGLTPNGQRWIDVMDRGGDFLHAMQQSRQLGHEFIVRVCQDRRLTHTVVDADGDEQDELSTVRTLIRTVASAATRVVSVASRGGRPAREVVTHVGYVAVRFQVPQWSHGLVSQAVTLIRVWEPGVDEARDAVATAKGHVKEAEQRVATAQAVVAGLAKQRGVRAEKTAAQTELTDAHTALATQKALLKERVAQLQRYLDWWLATSCHVAADHDACQVVSDYEWRWPVAEEYHKVEKTGLRSEAQRFETGPRMLAALAIVSVVAVRLLQLRYARDEQPDAPAQQLATDLELTLGSSDQVAYPNRDRATICRRRRAFRGLFGSEG
jgi:hypothetical protein